MKLAGALFALGLGGLMIQSVLATSLPHPWCPDLALLLVLGIGLCWERFGRSRAWHPSFSSGLRRKEPKSGRIT